MLGGVVHCVSDNPKSRQSGVFSSKIRVGLINRPFFPSRHEGGWGNSRQLWNAGSEYNILLCQYLRIAAVIVLDGQSTANA